jgi:hypothetical protein
VFRLFSSQNQVLFVFHSKKLFSNQGTIKYKTASKYEELSYICSLKTEKAYVDESNRTNKD